MTKGTLFSLKGVPELKAALKKPMSLAAVKTIVKTNTLELAQKTQQNMASTYVHTNPKTGKKYSTGDTRRMTRPIMDPTGLTGRVAPGTHYFPYVELGTRFMRAEPTLKPAFDEQSPQFIKDLKKLVK